MVKRGFILKQTLIILILLTSITLSYTAYIQQQIQQCKRLVTLEKQKAVELFLYSYFMSHLTKSEEKEIQGSTDQVSYQLCYQEDTSRLTSKICIDKSCYQWNLVYDHENKEIIQNTYE